MSGQLQPSICEVDAFDGVLVGKRLGDELLIRHQATRFLKNETAIAAFWSWLEQYMWDIDHRDPLQVTVDLYGHFVPGSNRAAVDRLADATAGVEPLQNFDVTSAAEPATK